MSSDDGIYIGRFVSESGEKTWRVVDAAAIKNTTDGSKEDNEMYIALLFGRSPIFKYYDQALKWAQLLDGEYDTEYGIVTIPYDFPFPSMSYEEAEKKLNDILVR